MGCGKEVILVAIDDCVTVTMSNIVVILGAVDVRVATVLKIVDVRAATFTVDIPLLTVAISWTTIVEVETTGTTVT